MNTLNRPSAAAALVGARALSACGTKENADQSRMAAGAASASTPAATESTGSIAGMPGMTGGMSGMMSAAMADSMQAQLRNMERMSANQLGGMVAAHRQRVANMLSQMTTEMRQMSMAVDPAWTATTDSVRQDWVHMPDMSGGDLKAFIPSHGARIMRLLQMHRRMMAGMKE